MLQPAYVAHYQERHTINFCVTLYTGNRYTENLDHTIRSGEGGALHAVEGPSELVASMTLENTSKSVMLQYYLPVSTP